MRITTVEELLSVVDEMRNRARYASELFVEVDGELRRLDAFEIRYQLERYGQVSSLLPRVVLVVEPGPAR